MRILIVCSGNTCRSPMAEVILREELSRAGIADIVVESAGIVSAGGDAMSPNSAKVLKHQGYDEGLDFRSRAIDLIPLENYDWIFCMTRSHLREMIHRFPHIAGRISCLAMTEQGLPVDISDPFGGPLESYYETYQEIKNAVMKLMVELKRENGQ